jgi:hypothetical protein
MCNGNLSLKSSPRVSIIALIYKSPSYAVNFYKELVDSTPELKDGLANFFYVANNANRKTLKALTKNKLPFYDFRRPELAIEKHKQTPFAAPEYIGRVYAAYNYGVEKSVTELVVLLNSDMILSPGWLSQMLSFYTPGEVLSPTLIERNHPNFGVFPGAIESDFGSNFKNFRKTEWVRFCHSYSNSIANKKDGGPYMPALMPREIFLKLGGFPEGNLRGDDYYEVSEYGDQYFFRILKENLFIHRSLTNIFCYHFKEGEKNSSFFSRVKFEYVPRLKFEIKRILRF